MLTACIPPIFMFLAFGLSFISLRLKTGIVQIVMLFVAALFCFASSFSGFWLNIAGYEAQKFLAAFPIVFGIGAIYEYRHEKNDKK